MFLTVSDSCQVAVADCRLAGQGERGELLKNRRSKYSREYVQIPDGVQIVDQTRPFKNRSQLAQTIVLKSKKVLI